MLTRFCSRLLTRSILCASLAGALGAVCGSAAYAQSAVDASLRAEVALVVDLETGTPLYEKNTDQLRPIASITKLMTALVVIESGQSLDEMLTIGEEDIDRMRFSRSRLPVGTRLTRGEMLHLALMSSENRAAHSLGRHYPGGLPAFIRAMNDKARALGMRHSRFVDPTGLSSENVATSYDLVKLVRAAHSHSKIRHYATDDTEVFTIGRGRQLTYNNTNRLVRHSDWDIHVSKTGFINEAGECLVMHTRIENRDLAIVLLNSSQRYSRVADATRLRKLVEADSRTLAMTLNGS